MNKLIIIGLILTLFSSMCIAKKLNKDLLAYKYGQLARYEKDYQKIKNNKFIKDNLNTLDENHRLLIFHASHHGNINLVKYLLNKGVSVNSVSKRSKIKDGIKRIGKAQNETLLHVVDSVDDRKRIKIALYLIENGFNLFNNVDINGNPILTRFCFHLDYEVIKVLLEKGTNPNLFKIQYNSPLWRAAFQFQTKFDTIQKNKTENKLKEKKLSKRRQHIIKITAKRSQLEFKRAQDILKELIKHGADPFKKDDKGRSIIVNLARNGKSLEAIDEIAKLYSKKTGKKFIIPKQDFNILEKEFKKGYKGKKAGTLAGPIVTLHLSTKKQKKIIAFLQKYK